MHVPVTSKMIYSNACIMFNELCLVLYLVNEGMLLVLSFYILEKYFSCISPECSSNRDLGQYFQHGVVIVLINCSNQHIQLCADIS